MPLKFVFSGALIFFTVFTPYVRYMGRLVFLAAAIFGATQL
jgi:hypothetical protein